MAPRDEQNQRDPCPDERAQGRPGEGETCAAVSGEDECRTLGKKAQGRPGVGVTGAAAAGVLAGRTIAAAIVPRRPRRRHSWSAGRVRSPKL